MGSGAITADQGILLAIGAIGLGALTIARRTLDTVGEGITDLPILAAIIVSLVGATIITVLSGLGIPASLAVSATSCIIGLGWGRASRAVTLAEAAEAAIEGEGGPDLSVGALVAKGTDSEGGDIPAPGPTVGDLAAGETPDGSSVAGGRDAVDDRDTTAKPVPKIGEESPEALTSADLFDRAATGRIVTLWLLTPTISSIGSYLIFAFVL